MCIGPRPCLLAMNCLQQSRLFIASGQYVKDTVWVFSRSVIEGYLSILSGTGESPFANLMFIRHQRPLSPIWMMWDASMSSTSGFFLFFAMCWIHSTRTDCGSNRSATIDVQSEHHFDFHPQYSALMGRTPFWYTAWPFIGMAWKALIV